VTYKGEVNKLNFRRRNVKLANEIITAECQLACVYLVAMANHNSAFPFDSYHAALYTADVLYLSTAVLVTCHRLHTLWTQFLRNRKVLFANSFELL